MFSKDRTRKDRSDLASDYRRKRSDLMMGSAKIVIKRAHKRTRRNARKEIAETLADLTEC